MSGLTDTKVKDTYGDVLHLNNSGAGIDATERTVQDGLGNTTPLALSDDSVGISEITRLSSNAVSWEDLRVEIDTTKISGATVPSWEKVADDGSGSTGVYAYHFEDGDECWFAMQIPHNYLAGSDIFIHAHWCPVTDVSPADNVGLGLEYNWTNISSVIGNTALVERDVTTGVNASYTHYLSDFAVAGQSGTGKDISSVLLCRFYRHAADSDNYAGKIALLYIDAHYQVDSFGSDAIASKT